MQHSVRYIVMFAAAVCVVCSIFVSSAAVLLKDRQEANKLLDRQQKVLAVVGLIQEGESLPASAVQERYDANIKAKVVELESGKVVEDIDAKTFDQQAAKNDPEQSKVAPANEAKVLRLPKHGLVYTVEKDGQIESLVFPIEGKGLWSTLYGYLALDKDARTVAGITFYQHGETPGLGGEVDNPSWKNLWPGRKAFGADWQPQLEVKKGAAGPVESDPYHVDGLAGATLTSRGVTHLVQFWLGEHGYGPFLANYRKERGIQ